MKLLAITDRRSLAASVEDFLARAFVAGVDAVQVREKDLPALDLLRLAERARELANPHGTRVLLNGRPDVALAAGLDGVHLPAAAPPADRVRPVVPEEFLIGVSCHSIDDLRRCEQEGADYALFSPIFPSASKPGYGPAIGVDHLARACRATTIPVYALGGVSAANARDCMEAGATGIAGISLFQEAVDLPGLVARLRSAS